MDGAVATNLSDLCRIAAVDGDLDEAELRGQEALAIRDRLGVVAGIAHAKGALSEVAFRRGDFQRATDLLEPHVETWRHVGSLADEGAWLYRLGACYRRLGALDEATQRLRKALEVAEALDDVTLIAEVIAEVGELALLRSDTISAVRLLGGAERARDDIGWPVDDPVDYEKSLADLRARLAPEELDRLWREGASLAPAELIEEALQVVRIP